MSRKILYLLIIVLVLSLSSFGCSPNQETKTGTDSKDSPSPEKITFQLNWLPEDPQYWVALDKGFWAEQNLDVNIIRGYGSADTVTKIAMKKADIASADIAPLILARAKDENVRVKAVANYHTYFPAIVIYQKDRGINEPEDLEGKTIMDSPKSAWYLFFPAFAKATGIDQSKIVWKLTDPSLHEALFTQGEVDAWLSDIEGIADAEKLTGGPVDYFSYSKDGNLDIYSQSIIVHEDMLREKPDVVRRFILGYLKGVKYSLEHPEEVGAIVKKYVPEIDADLSVKSWNIIMKNNLFVSAESREKGLGWMSRERMDKTIKTVLDAYDIKKELAPETIYTTEFLPKEPVYPPNN